jgi:hypothetical protein
MRCTRNDGCYTFSSVNIALWKKYNEDATCHILHIAHKQYVSHGTQVHRSHLSPQGSNNPRKNFRRKLRTEKTNYKVVGRVSVRNVNKIDQTAVLISNSHCLSRLAKLLSLVTRCRLTVDQLVHG